MCNINYEVGQIMEASSGIPSQKRSSISDSLLAQVARYTDGLVIISDINDDILWVNQSFKERTGYSLEEIKGKKPREVLRGPDTNSGAADGIDTAFLEGSRYECEILNYTKGREPFWLHLAMNPVTNEEGQVEYYVSIGNEITERKKKEQELNEAKERAEKIASEKQDLVSVLSHDIKSPLTSIVGAMELLQAEDPSDDQQELLDVMQMAADNMQKLIDNMLGIAKIESGEFAISPREVDLHQLILEIVEPLKVQAQSSNNVLSLDFDDSLEGHFQVDPLRFTQLLNNLVTNAIKFTKDGTIKVIVNERAKSRDGSEIQIEVRDTGCGISEESQDKIFSKFKQADRSVENEYGGSGLGLTISKYIVDKMEGDISLESELGEGTSFYINLSLDR